MNNKQMQRDCELLMDFSWGEKEICQTDYSLWIIHSAVIMAIGNRETSNLGWWFLSFSVNPPLEEYGFNKKGIFAALVKPYIVLSRAQTLLWTVTPHEDFVLVETVALDTVQSAISFLALLSQGFQQSVAFFHLYYTSRR